jgi:hypothetical protein
MCWEGLVRIFYEAADAFHRQRLGCIKGDVPAKGDYSCNRCLVCRNNSESVNGKVRQ